MADPRFHSVAGPFSMEELADLAGAEVAGAPADNGPFIDVMPLSDAGPQHVSFLDNKLYVEAFESSNAGACIVRPEMADRAPGHMALLLTDTPYHGYARVAQAFYPSPSRDGAVPQTACVAADAMVANSVVIEAGAVIGKKAEIGDGCRIATNAVIGDGVVIGEGGYVGPGASISHCIAGARVTVHAGVRIGQDGFGFALGPDGHLKVPQLGRVIIGDDVEIGANTTIDRGTGPDTMIGDGTKIDNLVQIAHNVKIGRHCVVVSQVGVSGSTEIGDFVMLGGQAGLTGHLNIGSGARIAAQSGVMRDIEPGTTVGGSPAKPMRTWLKEVAALERLVSKKGN